MAIEKKKYAGDSYESSIDGEGRGSMVLNSLSKSLEGSDEVLNEALQSITAPYITIA